MPKIVDFLKLMEGELIPNKAGTLKVDLDPYNLYRLMLRMPQPQNYVEPNGNALLGLLTFMDPITYAETKAKLDKFGIKYQEQDGNMNNLWDEELQAEHIFPVSPYPGNKATPHNDKTWDGFKPTATKPNLNHNLSQSISY